MKQAKQIVVIGAGIGGLTAGALLLKAGYQVTVLEAHVYPGGCAGTFYHKKYRFDAGATLAGGFSAGGPHARVAELLGLEWPVRPVDPAWVVHLPNGRTVTQWASLEQWREERQTHFPQAEKFWRLQEQLADISWDISARPFPWPPQSLSNWFTLAQALRPHTLRALPYLNHTLGRLAPADALLRLFLDGQLLISAQCTSEFANALYGSAALELPRRGVNHVRGGMGGIAETLANWLTSQGGQVIYREQVTEIELKNGRAVAVHTKKGKRFSCEAVLANLTPWALHHLLGAAAPAGLTAELPHLPPTWGAFMLYLGVDKAKFRAKFPQMPGHHQILRDPSRPLGEGNSLFFSMSDPDDPGRAPEGELAVTVSTHTEIAPWWAAKQSSPELYEERKAAYVTNLLAGLEQALPGFGSTITFQTGGTPLTFERFTRRPGGMVGGFAQTSLWQARGPRTGLPNVWLVGDSIFPGQSTAGVTLGGLRVADEVQRSLRG